MRQTWQDMKLENLSHRYTSLHHGLVFLCNGFHQISFSELPLNLLCFTSISEKDFDPYSKKVYVFWNRIINLH
jgi:hypothetical protein